MRRGKFCNRDCGDTYRKLVKQGGREIGIKKRECAAVRTGYVLFHNCIPGGGEGLDPFFPQKCRCRKTISFEKAKSLVSRGEAVDFETRKPFFNDRAIVQIGKLERTPRSMTIEKANAERSVGIFKNERKVRQQRTARNVEEMQAAVAQDKLERAEEELLRMDHYQFLTVRSMRIVQVPADQYDEMKANDPWQGRCPWENGIGVADERSSVSKDVSEPREFHSLLLESDVLREEEEIETGQPEDETGQPEDETENEDGDLTILTVEELEEVGT